MLFYVNNVFNYVFYIHKEALIRLWIEQVYLNLGCRGICISQGITTVFNNSTTHSRGKYHFQPIHTPPSASQLKDSHSKMIFKFTILFIAIIQLSAGHSASLLDSDTSSLADFIDPRELLETGMDELSASRYIRSIAMGYSDSEVVSNIVDDADEDDLSMPVHGNWCGPGHTGKTTSSPCIDSLDCACRTHDNCYGDHGYFNCKCDVDFVNTLENVSGFKSWMCSAFFSMSMCKAPETKNGKCEMEWRTAFSKFSVKTYSC